MLGHDDQKTVKSTQTFNINVLNTYLRLKTL
jgi:hypothetical protein